jgi:hypothetical protein
MRPIKKILSSGFLPEKYLFGGAKSGCQRGPGKWGAFPQKNLGLELMIKDILVKSDRGNFKTLLCKVEGGQAPFGT